MESKERASMKIYNSFAAYYPTKEEIQKKLNSFEDNSDTQEKGTKQRMSDDELIKRIYGID